MFSSLAGYRDLHCSERKRSAIAPNSHSLTHSVCLSVCLAIGQLFVYSPLPSAVPSASIRPKGPICALASERNWNLENTPSKSSPRGGDQCQWRLRLRLQLAIGLRYPPSNWPLRSTGCARHRRLASNQFIGALSLSSSRSLC